MDATNQQQAGLRKRGRPRKERPGGGEIQNQTPGATFGDEAGGLEGPEGSPPLSSPIVDHPPQVRLPRHLHGVPPLVLERPQAGESLESWMTRSEALVAEWSIVVMQDEGQPDALRVLAYSKMMDLMIAGRKGKLAAAGKAVSKVLGDRESALVAASRSVQGMSDAELMRVAGGAFYG